MASDHDKIEKKLADLAAQVVESKKAQQGAEELLAEAYGLFWSVTHRTNIGPGMKRLITDYVEFKLKPLLTIEVTDKIDRQLLDAQ